MPERKTFQPLTSSDVCAIYALLYKQGLVSFPITAEAEGKIDAIVANINSSYFGVEPYHTPEDKAVAYLYFLINDHPFTDGNKRTASLSFLSLCAQNGLDPDLKSFPLDALAVFIEASHTPHQELIKTIAGALFKG